MFGQSNLLVQKCPRSMEHIAAFDLKTWMEHPEITFACIKTPGLEGEFGRFKRLEHLGWSFLKAPTKAKTVRMKFHKCWTKRRRNKIKKRFQQFAWICIAMIQLSHQNHSRWVQNQQFAAKGNHPFPTPPIPVLDTLLCMALIPYLILSLYRANIYIYMVSSKKR